MIKTIEINIVSEAVKLQKNDYQKINRTTDINRTECNITLGILPKHQTVIFLNKQQYFI